MRTLSLSLADSKASQKTCSELSLPFPMLINVIEHLCATQRLPIQLISFQIVCHFPQWIIECFSFSAFPSNVFSHAVSEHWHSSRSLNIPLSTGPPSLWPNASNFVTLDIHENAPIDLLCPVTYTSDLSIQWAKNNEELDPMWSTGNLEIKRLILKIQRAQSTDAGLYRCNVVNGFGNVQAQFRVNVQGSSRRRVSSNERIVLVHLANGTVPHPVASNEPMAWDLDSLSGGNSKHGIDLRWEYSRFVEAPEFLARGDEAPAGATTVIQPEGTTVQLKCLASGKPLPEIRWKKNGKILSEDEYGVTQ